jgi:hypothetical protein
MVGEVAEITSLSKLFSVSVMNRSPFLSTDTVFAEPRSAAGRFLTSRAGSDRYPFSVPPVRS